MWKATGLPNIWSETAFYMSWMVEKMCSIHALAKCKNMYLEKSKNRCVYKNSCMIYHSNILVDGKSDNRTNETTAGWL
jgi:hypothetical protein